MRVQLVVTGDLERLGLAHSLGRPFRDAGHQVDFERPQKVHGMTSNPLPDLAQEIIPASVQRMATALVANTLVKRTTRSPLPDLVVGVDDLELANLDQPEVVVGWLRRAIHSELDKKYSHPDPRQRAAEALRERCSFHLLAPLVEAYFFGDASALAAAGVPAMTPIRLASTDLERFEVTDPDFLAETAEDDAKQASRGYAWDRAARHPKKYLQHLISPRYYGETTEGLGALTAITWPSITRGPATVPFIRALFEDLAELLGAASPLADGMPSPLTYPLKSIRAESRTLRNL